MIHQLKLLLIDMDGVLSDLERFIKENGYDHYTRSENLAALTERGDVWLKLERTRHFELIAKLMKETRSKGAKVAICSATGKWGGRPGKETTIRQKLNWLAYNGLRRGLEYDFEIFVEEGKDKALFASKNSFLIDDEVSNAKEFEVCGGASMFPDDPRLCLVLGAMMSVRGSM